MLREFIARVPFDQVIGSIHILDGRDIYEREYYSGRDKDAVFTRYFQVMVSMVRDNPFIDTLGHIDYICRVAPYEEPGLEYPGTMSISMRSSGRWWRPARPWK